MREVIDDKIDEFHEILMKKTGVKTAAAFIVGLVLLASLYVRATYKEYDHSMS